MSKAINKSRQVWLLRKHRQGFTLVELMVVISIIAILATMAAPSFARLIASTAVSGHVNTFIADARFARTEAIKRGKDVAMCRSDDPEAASPSCSTSAGTNWSAGWIIFIDENSNGAVNSDERIIRVRPALSDSGGISTSTGTFNVFTYDHMGNTDRTGTLNVKPKGAFTDLEKKLIVDKVGRVRWEAA